MRTGTPNELIIFLAQQKTDKRFVLKEHREKRTLSQNAYYWTLLTQVADKLRMSKTEVHNLMLRDYGRAWKVADDIVYVWRPNDDITDKTMLRDEELHFKPTDRTKITDCVVYRAWVLLKPTHEMTTEEMSVLVDGLVQEAKQHDIETLTPRELEELRQYEIQKQARKSDRHTAKG